MRFFAREYRKNPIKTKKKEEEDEKEISKRQRESDRYRGSFLFCYC